MLAIKRGDGEEEKGNGIYQNKLYHVHKYNLILNLKHVFIMFFKIL